MASAPTKPGWYRDPRDPQRLRYWSGKDWTRHQAPYKAGQPDPAAPRRWLLPTIVGLVVVALVGGLVVVGVINKNNTKKAAAQTVAQADTSVIDLVDYAGLTLTKSVTQNEVVPKDAATIAKAPYNITSVDGVTLDILTDGQVGFCVEGYKVSGSSYGFSNPKVYASSEGGMQPDGHGCVNQAQYQYRYRLSPTN